VGGVGVWVAQEVGEGYCGEGVGVGFGGGVEFDHVGGVVVWGVGVVCEVGGKAKVGRQRELGSNLYRG